MIETLLLLAFLVMGGVAAADVNDVTGPRPDYDPTQPCEPDPIYGRCPN